MGEAMNFKYFEGVYVSCKFLFLIYRNILTYFTSKIVHETMYFAVFFLISSVIYANASSEQQGSIKPAPENECDRQAAAPSDVMKPLTTDGVEINAISVSKALDACREAARLYPNEIRFQFQLGRTLAAAGEYKAALALYCKAAAKGSAAAMNNVGYFLEQGLSVEPDVVEATKWYQKAAANGNSVAKSNLENAYSSGQKQVDYAELINLRCH